MEQKTLLEWYASIDDLEVRIALLYEMSQNKKTTVFTSLRDAIISGFEWKFSSHGNEYWQEVIRRVESGEIKIETK